GGGPRSEGSRPRGSRRLEGRRPQGAAEGQMRRGRQNVIALLLATPAALLCDDVLQHHRNGTRDGLYIDPLMTQAAAAAIHRDPTFTAPLPGPTYAQPLYV